MVAVEIVGFVYEPDPVIVGVGTTVVWTNRDTTVHTATADDASFESGLLTLGATFRFTFTQPGEFSYTCTRHPAMVGIVRVVP